MPLDLAIISTVAVATVKALAGKEPAAWLITLDTLLCGIAGNQAEKIAEDGRSLLARSMVRLRGILPVDSSDDLRHAVTMSYRRATLQVGILLEQENQRRGSIPGQLFGSGERDWLDQLRRHLNDRSSAAALSGKELNALTATPEVLLQKPSEPLQAMECALRAEVLLDLQKHLGIAPERFVDLFDQHWFSFLCRAFQSQLNENPRAETSFLSAIVADIHQCQTGASPAVKAALGQLGESADAMLSKLDEVLVHVRGTPRISDQIGRWKVELIIGEAPPARPYIGQIPYRSLADRYIGRAAELWKLHQQLSNEGTSTIQGVCVVVGSGGLGKTQLAIEYAHRFGFLYPGGVFWGDAEQGLVSVIGQIARAAEVQFDPVYDTKDRARVLWQSLARRGDCLIVLDNFPEHESLRPYLPQFPTRVLATTRRRDLTAYPIIALELLASEDALKVLNSGQRQLTGLEATVLLERLAGLPLALELARGYLNVRPLTTIVDLLLEMDRAGEMQVYEDFAKRYGDDLPSGHSTDIGATFAVSWNLADSDAQHVLQIMSELAPMAVPFRLLHQVMERQKTDRALENLARLSLVELTDTGAAAHRLLLAFVRHTRPHDSEYYRALVLESVEKDMGRAAEPQDIGAYSELEDTLPHAQLLLSRLDLQAQTVCRLKPSLLDCCAGYLQNRGRPLEAEGLLRRALSRMANVSEAHNPVVANCQVNLARTLRGIGRFEEAECLLRMALTAAEKIYPPGDLTIAIWKSELATALIDLGRLDEAELLVNEALSWNNNSEPEATKIALLLRTNLTQLLWRLGRLDEAEGLLRENLGSQPDVEDASVVQAKVSLAFGLIHAGQLEEAEVLLRQALAACQNSFHEAHPLTSSVQMNLAKILHETGRSDEAETLLRSALTAAERHFVPPHPSIALVQLNLLAIIWEARESYEAHQLAIVAHHSLTTIFGRDHMYTQCARTWVDDTDPNGR